MENAFYKFLFLKQKSESLCLFIVTPKIKKSPLKNFEKSQQTNTSQIKKITAQSMNKFTNSIIPHIKSLNTQKTKNKKPKEFVEQRKKVSPATDLVEVDL